MRLLTTLHAIVCLSIACATLDAQVDRASAAARTLVTPRATLSPAARAALDAGALHVVDSNRAARVAADTPSIALRAGQFLAYREKGAAIVVRRTLAIQTPEPAGMPETTATTRTVEATAIPLTYTGRTADDSEVSLHPLMIKEKSLRYVPERGVFQGSFLMFLEDRSAPNISRDLGTPIDISVVSDDSLTPSHLVLRRTNELTRVSVESREPQDSVHIRVVPAFSLNEDIAVSLPVLPVVILERMPQRASGLGIQTVDILVGVHGNTPGDSVRVALTTDRGTLSPTEVVVPRGGHGIARLRSDGIGRATVSAGSPGIDRAYGTIQYRWPVDFLVIALIGGGLGAITTQLGGSRRRAKPLRRFVAGCVVGFAVALVYFGLGVNLLGISLPSQVLNQTTTFGLALLGGMLGIPALERTKAAKGLLGGAEPS